MNKWGGALFQRPPCRLTIPCLGRRHHRAHCLSTSVPLGRFLARELRGTSAVSLHWAQSSSREGPRGDLGEACRRSDIISSSSLAQKGDREVNRDVLNSCYLPAFPLSLHLASPHSKTQMVFKRKKNFIGSPGWRQQELIPKPRIHVASWQLRPQSTFSWLYSVLE